MQYKEEDVVVVAGEFCKGILFTTNFYLLMGFPRENRDGA